MTGNGANGPDGIRVGVLGASGYTGADLIRLLVTHLPDRDRADDGGPPRGRSRSATSSRIWAAMTCRTW